MPPPPRTRRAAARFFLALTVGDVSNRDDAPKGQRPANRIPDCSFSGLSERAAGRQGSAASDRRD
jgi:hypothetical protein